MTSIELDGTGEIEVDGSRVIITPPSTISVVSPAGKTSFEVEAWATCTSVELGLADGWCCAIGLEDGTVVSAVADPLSIDILGRVPRIDFGGSYDPGGFERIAYHELDGHELLLEWEIGVARVARDRVVWHHVHDDVTARVTTVTPDEVWLDAEDARFGYRAADGASIMR